MEHYLRMCARREMGWRLTGCGGRTVGIDADWTEDFRCHRNTRSGDGSTKILPTALWSCAWMRKVKSERWIAQPPSSRPGLPERQPHDYKRHGTTTLFAAFNILNGKVIGTCQARHRSREFVKFLNQIEKQVPAEHEVHLIMDNYCTHKSAEVQRG